MNLIQNVKISDIIVDDEIYPRIQIDFSLIQKYYYAMKAGAKFPPIQLGKYSNALYLIDGRHRLSVNKSLHNIIINSEIKSYNSKLEMFIAAVEANNAHGKALTFHDKTKIFKCLRSKLPDQTISALISVPVSKFPVLVDRIKNIDGIEVPFRSVLAERIAQKQVPEKYLPQFINPKAQNQVITNTANKMLESMIYFLERNLIDFTQKIENDLGLELQKLLEQKLNPKATIGMKN